MYLFAPLHFLEFICEITFEIYPSFTVKFIVRLDCEEDCKHRYLQQLNLFIYNYQHFQLFLQISNLRQYCNYSYIFKVKWCVLRSLSALGIWVNYGSSRLILRGDLCSMIEAFRPGRWLKKLPTLAQKILLSLEVLK